MKVRAPTMHLTEILPAQPEQWACLPLCSVCFPPESTPLGSMPVGVRPFSVSTLSLSSLQRHNVGGGGINSYFLLRKRKLLKGKMHITTHIYTYLSSEDFLQLKRIFSHIHIELCYVKGMTDQFTSTHCDGSVSSEYWRDRKQI